jgi:asparagine synthetase B (glutamine-hydrolysing)
MTNENGTVWVVLNGEIYNYRELREELIQKGHQFVSNCDTEVLVHLYEQDREEGIHRLRGMFAFALWDGGRRRLLLARDRTGKKPLYYRMDGDGIAFASEPKAFLADPSFEPRPDVAALSDHNVMEFCASLPSDLKIRRLTTKYLLKRAVRDLLPAPVVDRPKQGFGVPIDQWFRGELRAMVHDVLLDPRTLERGYFREPVVRRLLDEHARGVRGWHDQLWSLLVLELWHRTFVDRRPGAGSPLAAVGVHRAAALAP